jgi:ATP-dependent helicase/nuclease subunit A
MGRLLAKHAGECRRETPFSYALAAWSDAERTLLRGVIDCMFEHDDGLVILDYKSDQPRDSADFESRVEGYSVQIRLYAIAAGAVFEKPVRRATLVFLRGRRIVDVSVDRATLHAAGALIGESTG